jgi:hypothetical protein
MSKRNQRAGWALAALGMAVFLFADFIGYGSESDYNAAIPLSVGGAFAAVAFMLFAWNVATYKNQGR